MILSSYPLFTSSPANILTFAAVITFGLLLLIVCYCLITSTPKAADSRTELFAYLHQHKIFGQSQEDMLVAAYARGILTLTPHESKRDHCYLRGIHNEDFGLLYVPPTSLDSAYIQH